MYLSCYRLPECDRPLNVQSGIAFPVACMNPRMQRRSRPIRLPGSTSPRPPFRTRKSHVNTAPGRQIMDHIDVAGVHTESEASTTRVAAPRVWRYDLVPR